MLELASGNIVFWRVSLLSLDVRGKALVLPLSEVWTLLALHGKSCPFLRVDGGDMRRAVEVEEGKEWEGAG